MTLLDLAHLLAAVFGVIALLLLSVHVVELERRLKVIERERAERVVYKLERPVGRRA